MANFALAAILNISAILNCLETLQAIFDLSWSRLQKYIMKSVLTIIAHEMTIQTLLHTIFGVFFAGSIYRFVISTLHDGLAWCIIYRLYKFIFLVKLFSNIP
jgi:hypothetical protein